MKTLIEILKSYDSLRAITADVNCETKIPESDLKEIQLFHKDHFKIYGVKDSQVSSDQLDTIQNHKSEQFASNWVFCYEKGRMIWALLYEDDSTIFHFGSSCRKKRGTKKTSSESSEPLKSDSITG